MGFEIETSGFNEFEEELKDLKESIEGVDGENRVTIRELFPPAIMRQHTEFADIEEFFEESPWTDVPFEDIPEDDFDDYIDENTDFDSWEEMQQFGGNQWLKRQIGG